MLAWFAIFFFFITPFTPHLFLIIHCLSPWIWVSEGHCHLVTDWELSPLSSPAPAAQSSHWFRLALGQQRCKEMVLTPCRPDFFLGVRLRKTHSQNSSFPDLSCSLPALSPEQAEFSPSACKLLFSAWLRSPPSYDTLGNCPLITTITICTHFIKLISLCTGFLHRTAQLEAHFFSSA